MKHVLHYLLPLALMACADASNEQPSENTAPEAAADVPTIAPIIKSVEWVLANGLCDPETVLQHPNPDLLIVSNICAFKKNGKGYLSLIRPDGTMHTERWVDGFNAPAGMARFGNSLYVTDIDRVQVIDIESGVVSKVIGPFADARAFNDIAVDEGGVIYVSDSGQGKVLRIENGMALPFPNTESRFTHANGMHLENGFLFVGGERLWSVDIQRKTITAFPDARIADIDGIESDGKGGHIVSIVGGNLWHIKASGKLEEWTAAALSSTNHVYLPERNLVLVPTGFDNTILAVKP